jgi:hypothetical protein
LDSLTGEVADKSFVKPVFYNQVSSERLKEMIKNDKIFRIEGLEKGVNYLRAQ